MVTRREHGPRRVTASRWTGHSSAGHRRCHHVASGSIPLQWNGGGDVGFRSWIGILAVLMLVAGCGTDTVTASTATTPPTETVATTGPQPTVLEPTSVATTETPDIDLDSGLLAHYPLNGDAVDAGPSARHGEVAGAVPIADRDGRPSGALLFDGIDDLVTLDDAGFAIDGDFSITMWVKGNPYSDHQWVLLSDHAAGECQPVTESWILRYTAEAGVFFSVYDQTTECGSHFGYGSLVSLDDDEWHHLALVAFDGILTIFLDCQEILVGEAPIGLPNGPHPLLAGNQSGAPESTAFDGALDELRFYDRSIDLPVIDALCVEH